MQPFNPTHLTLTGRGTLASNGVIGYCVLNLVGVYYIRKRVGLKTLLGTLYVFVKRLQL